MHIGILQTGYVPEPLVEKHGSYPAMFERLLEGNGFTFSNFMVVENVFPDSVHACDGWLVTGSSHGAYEDHAFIPPLEAFIRASYAARVPIAGICFGHQIMAQALGGKVVKFDGGWGVGHTIYEMKDKKRSLFAMHQDQVVERPPEAEVIASNDFCENAGLAYQGSAISFQPHPEFTGEFMADLIDYKASQGGFSAEKAAAAKAELSNTVHADEISVRIAKFFIQSANAETMNAAE